MSVWKQLFAKVNVKDEFTSRLHKKLSDLLPNYNEEQLTRIACIAGLLARVAHVDLEIHPEEKTTIEKALLDYSDLSQQEVTAVSTIAIEEIVELSGLENHLYCLPLRETLPIDDRYKLVVSLFAVAAADGGVDNQEAEEVRHINQGLLLEHKHYISARTTILDKLNSLQG